MATSLSQSNASERAAGAIAVVDLGLMDYGEAYQVQRAWVARKRVDALTNDTLLLVEHPDVYTYGRRSRSPVLPEGVPVFEVERGGEVTFHNPGQLVAYPILSLAPAERDLHAYLRRLEEVLIATVGDFGIVGERRTGATGVWVAGKAKKIASVGVAVSSWVTYHGIALNVANDLAGFMRINPCGFSGEVMTSLSTETGENGAPSLEQAKQAFVRHFGAVFARQPVV
jgi:lipoyl(octanoyl) transferase